METTTNTFELKPHIGTVIGTERNPEPETITFDQDEVWCNGKRIGHVSHHEGAVCRINRVLSEPTKRELVTAVQKLRQEQGKPPIAERCCCLPNPKAVRKALTSTRRKR